MPEHIVYADCFSSADELSDFEDKEQLAVAATDPIATLEQPLDVSARQAAATIDKPNTELHTTKDQSDTPDSTEKAIGMLSLNETRSQEATQAGKAVRERYKDERHYRRAVASDQAWRSMRPVNRFDGTMGDTKAIRKQLRYALLAMMEMCPNDKKFKFYLETCFVDGARMWVVEWAAIQKKWDPEAFEKDFCDRFLPVRWNEGLLNELRFLMPTKGMDSYVKAASKIIQAMDSSTGDDKLCGAFLQFAPESVLNSFRADPSMSVHDLMRTALKYHLKKVKAKPPRKKGKLLQVCPYCRECDHAPHVCRKRLQELDAAT